MTERTKIMMMGATLMALLLPAVAQNSTPPSQTATPTTTQSATPGPETGQQIQDRKYGQQDRISRGVSDGQLTAGEASTLEKKESQINQEERQMKAADDGHLSAADRAKLQKQQNQLSNQIYKDNHNGANNIQKRANRPTSEEGRRAENQQDRIANGMKDGQLSAGEASHIEGQEKDLNQEVKAERALNGGRLTKQEQAQVNRQQNRLSKEIYKDKHNGRGVKHAK